MKLRVIQGGAQRQYTMPPAPPSNDNAEHTTQAERTALYLEPRRIFELARLGLIEPTGTNDAWRLTTLGRVLLSQA